MTTGNHHPTTWWQRDRPTTAADLREPVAFPAPARRPLSHRAAQTEAEVETLERLCDEQGAEIAALKAHLQVVEETNAILQTDKQYLEHQCQKEHDDNVRIIATLNSAGDLLLKCARFKLSNQPREASPPLDAEAIGATFGADNRQEQG